MCKYSITLLILFFVLFIIGFKLASQQRDITTDNKYPEPSVESSIKLPNDIKDKPNERYDVFGITKVFPDRPDGRQWFSNWNNTKTRLLKSGQRDQYDSEFVARGNGVISIQGNGIVSMSGDSPRMYVYDADKKKKWGNVEITVYAKRISETGIVASQGVVIGARSEHQDASEENPCLGRTYYARLLYDGRAVFQKEVIHEGAYSSNKPSENNKAQWETGGTMPKNVWIGMKFVVRTNPDNKSVTLELYRDMTDGENGGKWEKLTEYVDTGLWSQTDSEINVVDKCGYGAGKVLIDPGTSIFIRNDLIGEAVYKKFSIREIK